MLKVSTEKYLGIHHKFFFMDKESGASSQGGNELFEDDTGKCE